MLPRRPSLRALRAALVLPATAALVLAGCSDPEKTAAPTGSAFGSSIVLATSSEPDNLNPLLSYGPDGASLIFDGLVARDASNELIPALADPLPTISENGLTVTATLRDGVTFHDGSALTAEDVAFTYRSILDASVDSVLRSDLDMLESVEATDERTVEFTLAYAYAPFLQRLALGIVPAKAFEGQDINKAPFNTAPIGTGPYRLESWKPGERVVLQANPDYWGGTPKTQRVVVAFVPDDNVRAQRTQAGEFDAAQLPPKLAKGFEERDGYTVHQVPTADYRGVMLPMGGPVTGDVAIRRALGKAVDRKAMVEGVLAGAGEAAYGPVPPTSEYFEPSVVGSPTADTAAAAADLDAAGWAVGSDGIREKDGQRASFTLMYPASDSLRKELALAVTADAKKAGIEVNPEGLTWDAIEPRMSQDALLMGFGTPYDPDFVNYTLFRTEFAGQGFFNPGSYSNPEVDAALQRGRDSVELATRKEAYSAFQEEIAADAPWLYLAFLQHTYVVKDAVQGVVPRVEPHAHDVANSLWWNVNAWSKS